MKISRDYLKNIISEEVKSLLNEETDKINAYINNFVQYSRKNPVSESWSKEEVAALVNFVPPQGALSDEEKISATMQALKTMGLSPGGEKLPGSWQNAFNENLPGFVTQWNRNAVFNVAAGRAGDSATSSGKENVIVIDQSEKDKRIFAFANMVKQVLGNKETFLKKYDQESNALSQIVSSVVDDEKFKDLTYQEKMEGLEMLYGKLSTWPNSIRQVTAAMNPDLNNQAAATAGPAQQSISLTGTGGIKCPHAVTVQTQAKQIIQSLAKSLGLDAKQLQKLISRLSDGVLGNTTLTIMKLLSGGQMTDQEYPLNNKNSYKKACAVQKQVLDTILNNMKTKQRDTASVVMKAAGIQMGESKNAAFEKALKAAILRELQKNS